MGRRSNGFVKFDQGASRRRCGWKSREEQGDLDATSTAMEEEPMYVPPQINHFDESRSCMNLFVIHEHHTVVKPKSACVLMQQITRLNCGSNHRHSYLQDAASVVSGFPPAPTFKKQSQLPPLKRDGSSMADSTCTSLFIEDDPNFANTTTSTVRRQSPTRVTQPQKPVRTESQSRRNLSEKYKQLRVEIPPPSPKYRPTNQPPPDFSGLNHVLQEGEFQDFIMEDIAAQEEPRYEPEEAFNVEQVETSDMEWSTQQKGFTPNIPDEAFVPPQEDRRSPASERTSSLVRDQRIESEVDSFSSVRRLARGPDGSSVNGGLMNRRGTSVDSFGQSSSSRSSKRASSVTKKSSISHNGSANRSTNDSYSTGSGQKSLRAPSDASSSSMSSERRSTPTAGRRSWHTESLAEPLGSGYAPMEDDESSHDSIFERAAREIRQVQDFLRNNGHSSPVIQSTVFSPESRRLPLRTPSPPLRLSSRRESPGMNKERTPRDWRKSSQTRSQAGHEQRLNGSVGLFRLSQEGADQNTGRIEGRNHGESIAVTPEHSRDAKIPRSSTGSVSFATKERGKDDWKELLEDDHPHLKTYSMEDRSLIESVKAISEELYRKATEAPEERSARGYNMTTQSEQSQFSKTTDSNYESDDSRITFEQVAESAALSLGKQFHRSPKNFEYLNYVRSNDSSYREDALLPREAPKYSSAEDKQVWSDKTGTLRSGGSNNTKTSVTCASTQSMSSMSNETPIYDGRRARRYERPTSRKLATSYIYK